VIVQSLEVTVVVLFVKVYLIKYVSHVGDMKVEEEDTQVVIVVIIVEVIIMMEENGIIDLIMLDKWLLEEMNMVILLILDIMKIMLEKCLLEEMLMVILLMDDFIFF
jgi:hypothetical protein